MKSKKSYLLVFILLLTLSVTACQNKEADSSEEIVNGDESEDHELDNVITFDDIEEVSLDDFEKEEIILDSSKYDSLNLAGSEVLKESMLNILYVENDTLYGYGFGPSGDYNKNNSIYKLSFDGSFEEEIYDKNDEFSITINPNILDRENKLYYYMDISYNPSVLRRYDVENEELTDLIDLSENSKYDTYTPLYVNDEYFYYQDNSTNIKRGNIADSTVEEVTPEFMKDQSNLYFNMVYGENDPITFFRAYNRSSKTSNIYKLNFDTMEEELILKDKYLYLAYTDNKYSVFGDYDMETIVLYDVDNNDFIFKMHTDVPYQIISIIDDKYILLNELDPSFEQTEFISILDLENNTMKEIDISEILNENESETYKLFWDNGKLYIQWLGTFEDEDGNIIEDEMIPDKFYKINLDLFN